MPKINPQLNSVHREKYGRGAPCEAGVRHRNGNGRNAQGKPRTKGMAALWAAKCGDSPHCVS